MAQARVEARLSPQRRAQDRRSAAVIASETFSVITSPLHISSMPQGITATFSGKALSSQAERSTV